MRCAHCYQGDRYRVMPGLSWERLELLAKEMQELQVDNVAFSGGEPFLTPLTLDTALLFEACGLRVNAFFTNGLILDERILHVLTSLRSRPMVFMSYDAIDPEGMVFRGFTGSSAADALGRINSNFQRLLDAGIPIVVNTVMTKENIATLPAMYERLSRLPIRSWRIGFPKHAGYFQTDPGEHGLPWKEMAESSYRLLERHLGLGKPFHLQIEYLYREELLENLRPLSLTDYVCDYEGKRESCCIKPNGDVVSCAYCADFVVGNVNLAPLSEIWYSTEMQRTKNIRIADVTGCEDCAIRALCATGCRANAFFLKGSFEHSKDDYACEAVSFFVERVIPLLKQHGVRMDPVLEQLLPKK